jgi:hypothetical protein
MGKVKKNFFIIFLVLVLGVNNVLAGERFYTLAVFNGYADTPYVYWSGGYLSFMNTGYVCPQSGTCVYRNDNFKLVSGGMVQKIQFPSNVIGAFGDYSYWQNFDWSYVVNGKVNLFLYDTTSQQPLLNFGWVDFITQNQWQTQWYNFSMGGYPFYSWSSGNISSIGWNNNYYLLPLTLPSNNFNVPNVYIPFNHKLNFAIKKPNTNDYLILDTWLKQPTGFNISTWNGDLSVFIKFIGQNVYGLDLIKPPFGNQNYFWDTNDASNNFIIADIYTDNVYKNLNNVEIAIYDYQTNRLIWGYNKFIGLTLAQVRQTFDFSSQNLNDIIRNATSTSIFKLVFTAHLYNNTLTEKISLSDYSIFYVLGRPIIRFLYSDWYNSIIGNFGLSGATPTPIFVRAGQTLDNIFQTFQSFITIDNDKLNNLKASIINNLNSFIAYINGFSDALGFLKYLFYGLLIFTMIEFIVKFGRLIIPFK